MYNVAYKIAEISILDRIEKLHAERLPHLRWLYRADYKTSLIKEREMLATVEKLYAHLEEVEAVLYGSDYARNRNLKIKEWDLDVEESYETLALHIEQGFLS